MVAGCGFFMTIKIDIEGRCVRLSAASVGDKDVTAHVDDLYLGTFGSLIEAEKAAAEFCEKYPAGSQSAAKAAAEN